MKEITRIAINNPASGQGILYSRGARAVMKSIFIVLICSFMIMSCAQDSIFYNLSMEPEPIEPRIPGSPTNLAFASNRIYVGTRMSTKIYFFTGSGWGSMGTPGGNLGDLAGNETDLYALIYPSGNPLKYSAIRRHDGTGWTPEIYSAPGFSIQTIYCAGDKLFAGAMINYLNCAILCFDSTGNMEVIAIGTSLLKGAAECAGVYYLATLDHGVYTYSGTSGELAVPIAGTSGNITGIIATGAPTPSTIVAVSSGGDIFTLNSGETAFNLLASPGVAFTGAICAWNSYDGIDEVPALLLLGMRGPGTSLSHGYRELVLNPDGTPSGYIKKPGEESLPTSAKSKSAKYDASIGIHPVESIFQTPLSMIPSAASEFDLPVFASTSRNGVWSCRRGEWNAEP